MAREIVSTEFSLARLAVAGLLLFGGAMAFSSHAYRDPMDVYAAKQSRERRQGIESKRQPVPNSPLHDLPRRWIDADAPEPWSGARKAAEALFSGEPDERRAPSAARQAAEALFTKPV